MTKGEGRSTKRKKVRNKKWLKQLIEINGGIRREKKERNRDVEVKGK
jgi:hypothetical protein